MIEVFATLGKCGKNVGRRSEFPCDETLVRGILKLRWRSRRFRTPILRKTAPRTHRDEQPLHSTAHFNTRALDSREAQEGLQGRLRLHRLQAQEGAEETEEAAQDSMSALTPPVGGTEITMERVYEGTTKINDQDVQLRLLVDGDQRFSTERHSKDQLGGDAWLPANGKDAHHVAALEAALRDATARLAEGEGRAYRELQDKTIELEVARAEIAQLRDRVATLEASMAAGRPEDLDVPHAVSAHEPLARDDY